MGNTPVKFNEEELQAKAQGKLTQDQVKDLIGLIQKYNKGKEMGLGEFRKVAKELNTKYPDSKYFQAEYAQVVFEMLDTNNNKKINIEELVQGVAILTSGTHLEKAALTFDAFDLNKDGFLQPNEIRAQMENVYKVASRIMELEIGKEVGSQMGARILLGTLNSIIKGPFIKEQILIIMKADEDNDGKLSREEWLRAAPDNKGIQALLSPWEIADQVREQIKED